MLRSRLAGVAAMAAIGASSAMATAAVAMRTTPEERSVDGPGPSACSGSEAVVVRRYARVRITSSQATAEPNSATPADNPGAPSTEASGSSGPST